MGEYQAFPYLNHKVPEKPKAVYVEDKALDFKGLYTPRQTDELQLIGTQSKNYWRTRDDVKYSFYEGRNLNILIICCEDAKDLTKVFRTIVVSLEKLYFEVEAKARGSRDPLMKKKDKKIADDATLWKGCIEYLTNRLNFPADPQPWPSLFSSSATPALPNPSGVVPAVAAAKDRIAAAATTTIAATTAAAATTVTAAAGNSDSPKERMATLDKSGTDQYDTLELSMSFVLTLINHRCLSSVDPRLIRLSPPAPAPALKPAPAEKTEIAEESTIGAAAASTSTTIAAVSVSPRSGGKTKNDGKVAAAVVLTSAAITVTSATATPAASTLAVKEKPKVPSVPKVSNSKKVAPL